LPFLVFVLVTAPPILISLPFALRKEFRERRFSPLLTLAALGVVADLLLLLNYSTAIVWRYPLAAVPALAPLTGDYLFRTLNGRLRNSKRALIWITAAIVLPVLVFGWYIRSAGRQLIVSRSLARNYNAQLAALPRDAVVMAGQQTVAINYWRGIGEGEWDVIGTGGGWPGAQLAPTISNYLRQGRRVFLDSDPRWWFVCGWQREEIPEVVKLESEFRFRHVTSFVYEIRPVDDATANDAPNLGRLLPESRPADVARCFLSRR